VPTRPLQTKARYRGLVSTGAVSASTYDQVKAAADAAKAQLAALEAEEKVARDQGDYSLLVADANGTVVETLAEPGQVVAAGQTVVKLAHAGPREASIYLPETLRPTLRSTAKATLYGQKNSFPAWLRLLSTRPIPKHARTKLVMFSEARAQTLRLVRQSQSNSSCLHLYAPKHYKCQLARSLTAVKVRAFGSSTRNLPRFRFAQSGSSIGRGGSNCFKWSPIRRADRSSRRTSSQRRPASTH